MSVISGINGFYERLIASTREGKKLQIVGSQDSFTELACLYCFYKILQGASSDFNKIVIILPSSKDLNPWASFLEYNINFLLRGDSHKMAHQGLPTGILPYYSLWGIDRYINPAFLKKQRLYALSLLSLENAPSIIITTLPALAQKTVTLKDFRENQAIIRVNDEISLERLIALVDDLGYLKAQSVEEEGHFAVRGGLLDIFPTNAHLPLRIEFFGDTVSSIRCFSPADQKSKGLVNEFFLNVAQEAFLRKERRKQDAQLLYDVLLANKINQSDRDGIMDTFSKGLRFHNFEMFLPAFRGAEGSGFDFISEKTLLFFPRPLEKCWEAFNSFNEGVHEAFQRDIAAQAPVLPPKEHFLSLEEIKDRWNPARGAVEFNNPYSAPGSNFTTFKSENIIEFSANPSPVSSDKTKKDSDLFDRWISVISRVLKQDEGHVIILAHHEEQIERIKNLTAYYNIPATIEHDILKKYFTNQPLPSGLFIGKGEISSALWLDENQFFIISEHVLFNTKQRQTKPPSATLQSYLSSFKDLKVGDLVIHVQHGIGKYQGMTSLTVKDLTTDFLLLEYLDGDKIYLPVDRLNLLQRYTSGKEGGTSHLDKLGGLQFEKRKTRVRQAVRDMAQELLKLQAKRSVSQSPVYAKPSESYFKLEAEFPYEETDDQLRALEDVHVDLSSSKPMDRLICGDVGFGKTEIALRAAYRVVLDGYQVLVLVPTTVLCYQHYKTFQQRLSHYGITIGQVSRFVKGIDLKVGLEGLENGQVDILIGTHRLLSKDIRPKKLGLLIIDEEQRFGVSHKEKIKHLKAGVDLITMTATPIPRTLHMSMLGLRDISIIATPPTNRLAIKTYIAKFDELLLKEAILQEVGRGGQVFFVHNRVEDIEEVCLYLRRLVPDIQVRVAHGQLPENQLEKVIIDFIEQKFPVLVCTTIIESGIDMPNVNTLIVNKAENFGLAQLYQLRGRVGRSSQQAYAYFFTSPDKPVSDEATKRLDVLAAHQDLGSGFQIASYDLEIRGAGNLLGGEQSGHIAAVGLEMYTEMLENAIHEIRGVPVKEKVDAEIKLSISALIPKDYIAVEKQRLHVYKRIFSADSEDDLLALRGEIIDRFGPPPLEVERLVQIALVKRKLKALNVTVLTATEMGVEAKFASLSEKQISLLLETTSEQPQNYRLFSDYRLLLLTKSKNKISDQDNLLKELKALLDPLVKKFSH